MAILNFKKYGEGEPIIIMHGLYGSSDNWVSIARALMDNFSVYLLDLRNHGTSPHYERHSYDNMVEDLVNFMDNQQIYSAILMGHSMGGKVAMFFSAAFPERVKKMLVVDISPRTYQIEKGDLQFEEHSNILSALAKLDVAAIKDREEAEVFLQKYVRSQQVSQFLLKNLKRDRNKKFYWKINVSVLHKSILNILSGLEDVCNDLQHFKNPTLFIKGGNSNYINDIDKTLIAKLFVNSKVVNIENSSHWVHAEKPVEFLTEVRKFIVS